MLRKMMRRIDRSFSQFEDWMLFLTVSIALITAMANVILRKTTSDLNLYWSDEVVRKVIFFSTYFGALAAVRSRSLIRIDALPQIFPILKKPLTLFSHLMALIFSGIMVWYGGTMTLNKFHDVYSRTATLQIPEWIFYAVLPVMGAMMFVRTLIVAYEDWYGIEEGEQ
jgi:TRAP-type C4-dicarboxylate transport system permease small subunit